VLISVKRVERISALLVLLFLTVAVLSTIRLVERKVREASSQQISDCKRESEVWREAFTALYKKGCKGELDSPERVPLEAFLALGEAAANHPPKEWKDEPEWEDISFQWARAYLSRLEEKQ